MAHEAATEDEGFARRHPLGSTEHTGERLGVGAEHVVHVVRKLHPAAQGRDALRKSARLNRRRAELGAGRLVPGAAALALAARLMVDEGDPLPVRLGHDLVAEHRPLGRAADLLDIAPAEAAGEHTDDIAPFGLGKLRLLRIPGRVENDCPHRGVS